MTPSTIKNKESTTDTDVKSNRPKPVFFWNNADVMKWLKRHCEQFYGEYGQYFVEHEITGRSLIRLNLSGLERLGVKNEAHRDELYRTILKLKLKSDILDLKDLEKKSGDLNSSSTMTHGVS